MLVWRIQLFLSFPRFLWKQELTGGSGGQQVNSTDQLQRTKLPTGRDINHYSVFFQKTLTQNLHLLNASTDDIFTQIYYVSV